MPTVLIGPSPIRHRPGHFRELLAAAGFAAIEPPGNGPLTPADLLAALPAADALIAGGEPVPASVIAACPKLRVIARTGVGYDAVDVAAATARGIVVAITPGTNHESVAEQAFALLLALAKETISRDGSTRAGGWDRMPVRPLRGTTLGLVGLGRIGRAMATRAVAFGMAVIAFDPATDADFDASHGIRRAGLDDLQAAADVVSLHLPLTPETRGLFDRLAFARMKPGSILINTARGGLVVEDDLHAALVSGHLAGAGLDVFESEPPRPANPLLSLPNVVVSPHLAGADARAMADMADLAVQCVIDLHSGRWPEGCVVNEGLREGWEWRI